MVVDLEADIVILGAGFAGLACAERLAAEGADFTVLEARDRVGGRAWTDYRTVDGFPLELGALMVHGRNVATQTCITDVGLHTDRLLRLGAIRLSVDRRLSSFPWMALPFHPRMGPRSVYAGLVSVPRQLAKVNGPDRSLRDYLDGLALAPGARALVELNHAHIFAMDPDAIGVLGPAEETRAAPVPWDYRNYRIVEGYSELATRMAAPFQSRIRLGTVVHSVRWSSVASEVIVDAVARAEPVRVRAHQAVVTLPLGVLRSGSVVFDPPLPEDKLRAIDELVMTDAFTLHIQFRGEGLQRKLGQPSFLWGRTPSSFFIPKASNSHDRPVVSAFTVGKEARRRAALSDAEALAATLDELRALLPNGTELGSPERTSLHRWAHDPLAGGAYSAIPLGGRLSARQRLAAPVAPGLYFAGEATHAFGAASTVHGAIETGRRAAEEVLAPGTPDEVSGTPRERA